jgi:hypothetical protein
MVEFMSNRLKQTVNNFDDIMNFERSNQQHTSFKSSGIEEL